MDKVANSINYQKPGIVDFKVSSSLGAACADGDTANYGSSCGAGSGLSACRTGTFASPECGNGTTPNPLCNSGSNIS